MSGSTVHADDGALPLRNVPVVRAKLSSGDDRQRTVSRAFEDGRRLFGDCGDCPFAIALEGADDLSYAELRRLGVAIAQQAHRRLRPNQIIAVIVDADRAKALGQAIALHGRGAEEGDRRIVCLDPLLLKDGDYIDAGEQIAGRVVPVMIKTLVFPTSFPEKAKGGRTWD